MPHIGDVLLQTVCDLVNPPPPPQPVAGQPAGKDKDISPTAPPTCKVWEGTVLANGLPLPGSKEFCDLSDDIKKGFVAIRDAFIGWFAELDPLQAITDFVKLKTIGGIGSAIYNTIIGLWNNIVDRVAAFATYARDQIKQCVLSVISFNDCIAKRLNPDANLGVWLMKQFIDLLESIHIGWDLGVDITADVKIEFGLVSKWLDIMEQYFAPIEPPSAQDATRAWLLDRITEEHRDCVWQLNGMSPDTYKPFAETEREQLDWREAIQYARRLNLGDKQEDEYLRQRGFVTAWDVGMAKEMFWELPGIADHLHWLQRNVFDADYVRDYQLLSGFDERFWTTFGDDLTALGMRKKYAAYHYAAHWIMPSPEQMKEFLYRTDEIKHETGKEFNLNDYERILAEQDYNPLVRQWFSATAYQVPAISYIKEWYRQGIIDRKELESYHRRLGYSFADASLFADIDDIQKARMRTSQSKGWTTGAATTAWFAGQMDEAEHTQHFADLGYTMYEAGTARDVVAKTYNVSIVKRAKSRVLSQIVSTLSTAIDIGAISASDAAYRMVAAGWPRAEADAFAALQSALGGTRRIKQGITYLRRMVLTGVIGFPTAQLELTRMGIVPDAMQSYLALWQLQLTPGRKRRSATDIVNDVANGHMTTVQAVVRLSNLGYDNADTMLYLADAQAKLMKTQTAIAAAAQKKGLAKAKAQAAVAKAAQKQHDDTVKAMKREIPVAKLQKWAKLGIIGLDFFTQRMLLYGYTAIDAEWYYEEACKGKGAACVAETPEPTNPIADSSGGSSDAGGGGKAT